MLFNSSSDWKEVGDFEERLEACLDALTQGGDSASEVCREVTKGAPADELFAAVSVHCRQGRKDLVIGVLKGHAPENEAAFQALVDALKYELPVSWQGDLVSLLQSGKEQLCSLISAVIGYRRLPAGSNQLQALGRFQTPPMVRALGRLRELRGAGPLLPLLGHEDEAVCFEAALSLLRLGEWQALDHCRQTGKEWGSIPLALGGEGGDVLLLKEIAQSEKAPSDALLALGILGERSIVPILLEKLGTDLAPSAALALNLITGAELYERVFIPEEFEEDELFDDEKEAFRQGKMPTKPDGTPYGEWVTRLSQNPGDWSDWWERNGPRFTPGVRYRNGKPFSPACLLENLEHEKSPFSIRQLAYEELVIRYGVDFHFEADMPVKQQLKVLAEIGEWIKATEGRFREGCWYFAGELFSD